MKTKIYLAKSNRANPDDVSRVRSLLSKYPNDIEVVEFKGGAYSHKDLKACDILMVIPDLSVFDSEDAECVGIGKGLHEQIMTFKNQAQHKCDTLVIFDVDDDYVSVTQVEELDITDTDDYINYSTLILDQEAGGELESLLLNRFVSGEPEATQTKGQKYSNYMYILIG